MNVIALPPTRQVRSVADMATIEERLAVITRAGMWTPEQSARFDALRNASFVLVRIDGEPERWRCRRCNGKHEFLTLMCLPRPFRGVLDGLHAYWHNLGAGTREHLSSMQRTQLDAFSDLFGPKTLPLAATHPEMAAKLATGERDVLIGCHVLGSLERITPTKARFYVDAINFRARQRVVTL